MFFRLDICTYLLNKRTVQAAVNISETSQQQQNPEQHAWNVDPMLNTLQSDHEQNYSSFKPVTHVVLNYKSNIFCFFLSFSFVLQDLQ